MTLRHYLSTLAVATVIAWLAAGVIIGLTDPTVAPAVVIVAFFACLWLALAGTFAVLGFLLRFWILGKEFLLTRQVTVSFRQGLMLSSLIVIGLILLSRNLMSLWVAILLVLVMTLLESFFVAAKRK